MQKVFIGVSRSACTPIQRREHLPRSSHDGNMSRDVKIIGKSRGIRALLRLVEMCAPSDAPVLISGESGTGKELVAQRLHSLSERSAGPFVTVNCAAIPKDLLESELFGYRKGAFSGAVSDRKGRFELAHNGTLFLDEIGDMALEMQAKLLRALQEGVVDPIGSTSPVRINARIVSATHKNLESDCSAGRFREDLFYRLNVLPITVPSLRDRSEDIPDLLDHFARHFAPRGKAPVRFDTVFETLLHDYSWPGNIRELSNFVRRMSVVMAGRMLGIDAVPSDMLPRRLRELALEKGLHVPAAREDAPARSMEPPVTGVVSGLRPRPAAPVDSTACATNVDEIILIANGMQDFPADGVFLKEQLAEFERKIIRHALAQTGGNITRTADLLNLQRTTLVQKLKKFQRDGLAVSADNEGQSEVGD